MKIIKNFLSNLKNTLRFTLVNYQDAESIPSHEYKMAFISSGGVEAKVVSIFSICPIPLHY